nr:DUF3265 domain-containing protein [Vibrio coralliilyticus]
MRIIPNVWHFIPSLGFVFKVVWLGFVVVLLIP